MSRTLSPEHIFKYIIITLLTVSTYSCSAVRQAAFHQHGTVKHQTGEALIQDSAPSAETEAAKESCDCENNEENQVVSGVANTYSASAENDYLMEDEEEYFNEFDEDEDMQLSAYQFENCTVSEAGTADDNCSFESFAEREFFLGNSIVSDDPFYATYSERLGIWLNGNENKELIMAIDDWFGTRYKWGGCSKYGVDCSCFVKAVYKDVYGINLQRTSRGMYYSDLIPVEEDELQEGDILCFKIRSRRISHVGIYLGDGKFAHSSRSKGVMINDLDQSYYRKRFFTGGRVIARDNMDISKASEKLRNRRR
jgi:lipoprotein Spr